MRSWEYFLKSNLVEILNTTKRYFPNKESVFNAMAIGAAGYM